MNVVVAIILAQVAEALEADPTLAAKLRTLLAPAAPVDPFVPVGECGLQPGTRKRLTKAGQLPVFKSGSTLLVRRADVAAYVASREVVRAAPSVPEGDEAERLLSRASGPSTKTGFRSRGSR